MNYFSLIRFKNFRNLVDQDINLSDSLNIFIGPNGSGKTNILESISLFLPGKGMRKEKLNNITNVKTKEPWVIYSNYKKIKDDYNLSITYDNKNINYISKQLFINGKKEKKNIELNIIPPILWFVPEMEGLFSKSPSTRRGFIDRISYSLDPLILNSLNEYNKAIKERSNIIQNASIDYDWLDKIEQVIAKAGLEIIKKRNKCIQMLNMTFKEITLQKKQINCCEMSIVGDLEKKINYENFDFFLKQYIKILEKSREVDKFRGGCSIGPHKSDFNVIFSKNGLDASLCSTGQQKEIILSILLCQSYILLNDKKTRPIILLDEICSHLDENTRSLLIYLIEWLQIQVMMTGTDQNHFSFLLKKAKFFSVKDGNIKQQI